MFSLGYPTTQINHRCVSCVKGCSTWTPTLKRRCERMLVAQAYLFRGFEEKSGDLLTPFTRNPDARTLGPPHLCFVVFYPGHRQTCGADPQSAFRLRATDLVPNKTQKITKIPPSFQKVAVLYYPNIILKTNFHLNTRRY